MVIVIIIATLSLVGNVIVAFYISDSETELEQRCSEKNHSQSSVVFLTATIQQQFDRGCTLSKYTISRNTLTAVNATSTSTAIIKPTAVNSSERQRKTTTQTYNTLTTKTTTIYEIATSTYGIKYLYSIQKVGNQFSISDKSYTDN